MTATVTVTANAAYVPASTGAGKFTVAVAPAGADPLPAGLRPGSYQSWCVGSPKESATSQDFTATVSSAVPGVVLQQINYVLNHKQGTVSDVQNAIWTLLGSVTPASLTANRQWSALAMYTDAVDHGVAYTPTAGQTVGLVLMAQLPGTQSEIIELVNCGIIGQRVWNDQNLNGAEDVGESGINGVEVQLLDAVGRPLATVRTSPSPISYPYLPAGTDGWYQFTGVCPGNYQVSVNPAQPALAVSSVSPAAPSVRPVSLDASHNPMADTTLDFGFTGLVPLTLTCPQNAAIQWLYYSSRAHATGGIAGYRFSVASGSLPPGVSLDATTGVFSGTPLAGSYQFILQVNDSTATAATSACGVLVNTTPIAPSCPTARTGQVGSSFNSQVRVSGGTGAYSYSLSGGALPAGLSLDQISGAITGMPVAAGTFGYSVVIWDTSGTSTGTASISCSLNIAPPPLNVQCPNGLGVVNSPYRSKFTATGGQGNGQFTFTVGSGTLPAGLALDPGIGSVSGTPATTGAAAFSVQVKDSTGAAAGTICTIAIQPPVAATCPSAGGVAGASFQGFMTASGGLGVPYTFSSAAGLPPGVVISANGLLSGTPVATGAYSFTTTITDGYGNAGTSSCQISIAAPPLTLGCAAAGAQVGVVYASSLSTAGGVKPYKYSVSAGALPAGIVLDSVTGSVTGKPAAAGRFDHSVAVADATGTASTASCSIVVAPPPLTLTCPSGMGTTGIAFSSTAAATGGTTPFSFGIVSGALPAGVVLNPSTGSVTGIPLTGGVSAYAMTVSDGGGAIAATSCSTVVNAAINMTGRFTTFTQGGWGSAAHGTNPASVLQDNWKQLYATTAVVIGGQRMLTFTSASAIQNFLPQGGKPGVLGASAANPKGSSAGVFAGQVLALHLNVEFSLAGIFHSGLSGLVVQTGKMKGQTVGQVLAIADQVLGGSITALPASITISDLNDVLDCINNNFDEGTSDSGYLR